MTDLKPVPCPLLPGVEPKIGTTDGKYFVGADPDSDDWHRESVIGRSGDTEAEAITAWNEWMESIEVKP